MTGVVITGYVQYFNILRGYHQRPPAERKRLCATYFTTAAAEVSHPDIRRRLAALTARERRRYNLVPTAG